MKKIILILLLLFSPCLLTAKEYEYELPYHTDVRLNFSETAHLGSAFLTEEWGPRNFVQIIFCGIDSNNNIRFVRSYRYNGSKIIINLIFKLDSQKHIFLEMLLTTVEIAISPVNSSYIKIKLFPNKYIKKP